MTSSKSFMYNRPCKTQRCYHCSDRNQRVMSIFLSFDKRSAQFNDIFRHNGWSVMYCTKHSVCVCKINKMKHICIMLASSRATVIIAEIWILEESPSSWLALSENMGEMRLDGQCGQQLRVHRPRAPEVTVQFYFSEGKLTLTPSHTKGCTYTSF